MNSMTKTALIGAGILSMSALAACQSASTAKEMQHPQKTHGPQHERGMTPEQHEQMQRMRAERHDMMQHWSDYLDSLRVGNVVSVKFG